MKGWVQARRLTVAAAAALAAGAWLVAPPPAGAQVQRGTPDELQGIEITPHLGDTVPLDLEFVDEQGRTVRLGDYFDGERPVVLSMGYYGCPMLCDLVWMSTFQALKELRWTAGQEFRVLNVTIDPGETPRMAREKRDDYLESYGRPSAKAGIHFLTGQPEAIRSLAETVGFGYRYVPERDEYAHAAGIMILSPEGKLSRYLFGVQYDPKTVRMALLEASEGKIGSAIDRVVMYCFHYDPEEGKYTMAAMNVMRLVGAFTVVVLSALIAILWRRERRRRLETEGEAAT
jgi:protein SCO1/2